MYTVGGRKGHACTDGQHKDAEIGRLLHRRRREENQKGRDAEERVEKRVGSSRDRSALNYYACVFLLKLPELPMHLISDHFP